MKIKVTTTNSAFIFGLGWDNPFSKYGRPGRYSIDIILGCIVIRIGWELKGPHNQGLTKYKVMKEFSGYKVGHILDKSNPRDMRELNGVKEGLLERDGYIIEHKEI